ncbi:exopolysaccharide biosynthesis protein [Luteimonas sp. BDR2-5]|uniref:exopolysaccharide biosynthesis protein n=1 Tax=Proluteimonas luteida TaxID=2878685 RepID=UPI001E47F195|nr:exopolysaccharide biosynthesis protein [Luteimonas sp. BDR2-5]MCD9029490.1 exopolysaccharide biosynthesis protein [Luteimonas sp. BDR2-5]
MSAATHTADPLGDRLERIIATLDDSQLTLGEMIRRIGGEGLLMLSMLLTVVFLIPVSIPGVSTVFGAALVLIGISHLTGKPLWLPGRLRDRHLPAEKLQAGLGRGLVWVRRLERVSRPGRLAALSQGRAVDAFNSLAFIFAALLLMAPFGFVPFSNTVPAIALLFYAIGLIQRDGVAILLGHLSTIGTVIYFSVLIGGGGYLAAGLWQHFSG